MTKCRVYYQQNGKISVDHADQRAGKIPDGMTNDEWIDAQFLQSSENKPNLHVDGDIDKPLLDFDEVDDSTLPNGADPTNRKDRDRWRGNKAIGIKIDNTVILRKDLEKDLDDELDKPNPNQGVINSLQRRLRKKDHD